jgi:phospholipid/cholesterol/gamma-HCH transport system substrate-binding protein
MSKAIREHLRDFVAILVLLVLALAVTLAILTQQRIAFPDWVPFVGEDRFELKAEFSTAQAVVPGQGQTVNLSGVKVGDVAGVDVEQGRAVVTLSVEEEYASLITDEATMLLRPRTGLNDMTVEVDGGGGKPVEEGTTIPVSQTQPNVQPDEILRTLDADTRAYLKLLLAGGAQGLGGRGEEFSATLRRFEPLSRDLSRIGAQLAQRRENIRRSITNFRLVSEALGRSDTQLGEFVDSSNATLGAFAQEEAAIRGALREFPPTLRATRAALSSSEELSEVAAPALRRLVPPSVALGPALREVRPFLERTTGPLRDQIRPFTREVERPLRHLRGASEALVDTTPALAGGFTDLNRLLNMLAFNPAGDEEGFLFWASWLNQNGNALFFTQDASGPLRHGMVLASCQTLDIAETIGDNRPFIKTLLQATRLPSSEEVCQFEPGFVPPPTIPPPAP